MPDKIRISYDVEADNFANAGEASSDLKNRLMQMGVDPRAIRKVAIAMYEGEINMVIHANGGRIDVEISPDDILMTLKDTGPGIPDIEKAMEPGYSTASAEVRDLGFGAGLGLSNMKSSSDEMKIDTEVGVGTTVTMKVYM